MCKKPPLHTIIVELLKTTVQQLKQCLPNIRKATRKNPDPETAFASRFETALKILSEGHIPENHREAVASALEGLRDKNLDAEPFLHSYVSRRDLLIAELREETPA